MIRTKTVMLLLLVISGVLSSDNIKNETSVCKVEKKHTGYVVSRAGMDLIL